MAAGAALLAPCPSSASCSLRAPIRHRRAGSRGRTETRDARAVCPPARRRWPCCALAPAAMLGPSLAAAQALPAPPIAQLAPVVVTAARMPQPIATLTADLTVIDADAIAAAGARSLAELLQGQPGVEIVQNGGPGSTSGVFLRGANRGQTVLLVDGLRVSSSTVGAPTLEAIPLDQIERIEILRGPASSLYGADAIGGVIQVFTRRPGPGVSGRLSGGLGTDDTRTVAGGLSATLGAVALSLQAGHRQSDGFNATTDPSLVHLEPRPRRLRQQRRRRERDGDVRAAGTRRAPATCATGSTTSSTAVPVSTIAPAPRSRSGRSRAATGSPTRWTSQLIDRRGRRRLGVEHRVRRLPLPHPRPPVRLAERVRRCRTAPRRSRSSGARSASTRARVSRSRARDTNAIVGVLQFARSDHTLQANLRHDQSTQYGGQTTGAIAWGYRFAPQWRVTASYGTAFKAPSFNDLYYPGFSNPDLEPETARNVEAQHRTGRGSAASGGRARARSPGTTRSTS